MSSSHNSINSDQNQSSMNYLKQSISVPASSPQVPVTVPVVPRVSNLLSASIPIPEIAPAPSYLLRQAPVTIATANHPPTPPRSKSNSE